MECSVYEELGIHWVRIEGRIDGMTCGEVRRQMDDLIRQGKRIFAAHLGEVTYISSAGLRVFLEVQKQLKKVGGEMILFGLSGNILKTFDMSGFSAMFRTFAGRDELEGALSSGSSATGVEATEVQGIAFRHTRRKVLPGELRILGRQEKLLSSGYSHSDVITVRGVDVQQGFGLATLGDDYEEYKDLFGEALVLNRSLFFYPAAKRAVADFMLCAKDAAGVEYRFLNGAGFGGGCGRALSFEGGEEGVELSRLVQALFHFTEKDLLGIVLLAESRGLWGMNLRKSPVTENRPSDGKEIFDPAHFREWMNFPVEPGEFNRVVACVGVAVREPKRARPEVAGLLAEGQRFHLHGAVFSRSPLSKDVTQFEAELDRVVSELEVAKVQHILGQTRFGSGMAGLFELND